VELQALVKAFNQGFLKVSLFFAAGILLVLFLRRPARNVKIEGAH